MDAGEVEALDPAFHQVREVALHHLNSQPPDLPQHLGQYQRLMDKLVEKDRDARFRNADEVIGFLSRKFYQGTGAYRVETTIKL